jgi:hypothetical protein
MGEKKNVSLSSCILALVSEITERSEPSKLFLKAESAGAILRLAGLFTTWFSPASGWIDVLELAVSPLKTL